MPTGCGVSKVPTLNEPILEQSENLSCRIVGTGSEGPSLGMSTRCRVGKDPSLRIVGIGREGPVVDGSPATACLVMGGARSPGE